MPTRPAPRYADRRQYTVPRTLRDLIAAEAEQLPGEGRRRRRRKAMATRRTT